MRDKSRLIQKIYETDPLGCPKCSGKMKILYFIEDPEIIKKILKHLDLWDIQHRPPLMANDLPINIQMDCSARPGATRLPVAAQNMRHSKCDFLRIQCL